jgi:hypothetical protein
MTDRLTDSQHSTHPPTPTQKQRRAGFEGKRHGDEFLNSRKGNGKGPGGDDAGKHKHHGSQQRQQQQQQHGHKPPHAR